MRNGVPSGTDDRFALGLVIPAGLMGVLLAWTLGGVPAASAVRFGADIAGATVLGLAVLPRLADRIELPWRMMAVLAGLWCCLEFATLVFAAGEVVGSGATALSPADFGTYLARISAGQIGLAILLATGARGGVNPVAVRGGGARAPGQGGGWGEGGGGGWCCSVGVGRGGGGGSGM
ncbi:hypothetical protein ACLML9_25505, partial [Nocardia sp. NPDC002869]